MKYLLLSFLFIGQLVQAQNIDSLINAEKSFAAYALSHNTKDAFILFPDKEGLVFEKGMPVNAKENWSKKEVRGGILAWEPMWAELASSGDYGYTTGPWAFHPKSITDSAVASGYFTTIWHKDESSNWRFLVDMGVGNTPAPATGAVQKLAHNTSNQKLAKSTIEDAEKEFIQLFSKNKLAAYKKLLSNQCILHRNGHLASTTNAAKLEALSATPGNLQFNFMQSNTAPSGDMGFSYGTITVNGKTDSYLHIWRKEESGWKIAVEVLRY